MLARFAMGIAAMAMAAGAGVPLVKHAKPVYPPLAKEAGISGAVKVEVSVNPEGRVEEVRVLSGHPLLVAAAVEAVKQWEYEAPRHRVVMQVQLNFDLNGDKSPRPTEVRGGEQQAKLINKIAPAYPAEAKQKGLAGTVELEAFIDKEGKVTRVRVLDGDPALVEAAVDAVRQWTYEPTVLEGNPVPVVTRVNVNFKLAAL